MITMQAQTVMTVDPPSVTITDTDVKVIKVAIAQIKARTTSTIDVGTFQYTIAYENAVYKVYLRDMLDDDDPLQTDVIFESTRVADVRTFMTDELKTLFDSL
ncbi:MAG: hypothetical protein ACTSQF_00005 [Candidatus Heimdallarchaeaceae archaeon]